MKNFLETHFDLNNDDLVSAIDELPLWSAPFGLSLLKTIQLKKNINVLDIGFGLGFPIIEIAMRLGNSSKVYGIDPWKAAIKRTRAKIKQNSISNIELIEGVAEDIPLKENSIDLIVSNNGINNVADLQQTLAECKRVAKKGAQFVLTVNLQETMIEFYNVYKEILIESGLETYIDAINEQIYKKRKPVEELKALLEQNEFSINMIEKDQFDYQFIDGTAMFRHFLISLGFLDSWKNVLPREYQEDIFEKLEIKINQIAGEQGGFSLSVPFITLNCYKN